MTAGALLIAAAPAQTMAPTSLRDMIVYGHPTTKVVLALLVLLSVISWMIIIFKGLEFRSVGQTSRAFVREFEGLTQFDQVAGLARRARPNPFARVLERALRMVSDVRRASLDAPDAGTAMTGSQVEALRYVLEAQASEERDRLGHFIPWLATIGSVSPLIGLLGTVLGVIEAFIGIAQQGSGNIAAVGPGVAEALVATAAALSVAIPAVFGYNFFANRLNRIEGELDGFGSEIIAMLVGERKV